MTVRTYLVCWLLVAGGSLASAQTVIVDDGATEEILGGSRIDVAAAGVRVKSGGVLRLEGTSATVQARFYGSSAGAPIDILSGGTIDLKYAKLENLTTLVVRSGARIRRLHDTAFTDLAGLNPAQTPWIDLSETVSSDRANLPFSFNRTSFADSQSTPTRKNVRASSTTPIVRLLGNPTSGGNRWGNSYDDDSSNRVLWNTGSVIRSGDSAQFDTVEDALKDAMTVASSTLSVTLGPIGFIDDTIDWNTNSSANSTGPVVMNALLAPMVGPAVQDSGSGSPPRGVLVNCVVARGSVAKSTAYNCTFFDPSGSLSVTDVTGTNLLIESDATTSGNSLTTSLTNVTSTFFGNSAAYDFHLVTSGGNNAIDTGSSTPYGTDFDGNTRGYDVPSLGASPNWDMGADEFGPPSTITTSHKVHGNNRKLQASGVEGSRIGFYRDSGSGPVFIGSAIVIDGVATFYDTDVLGEGTYTYSVAYEITPGVYGPLAPMNFALTVDNTKPAPPTNIRVTPYSGAADVEWDASVSADVIGYNVYRKEGTGPWILQNMTAVVLGLKYRDASLTNGVTYVYRLTAIDDAKPE